jgi:spore germination protein KC
MNKYVNFIVILLLGSFILSSCSGKVELNEILIVSAIGIDQEDDQTIIHLQVVNAAGPGSVQSSGIGGSVYTYSVQGKTLFDAINQANNILPRKVIFSHITCFVISEEYARDSGIAPILDFMERNNEIRDTVLMFVAKNSTAKDILSLYTPIFKNPGESLGNRVKISSSTTGISEGIKLNEIVNWTYGEFRDPVILGVERFNFNEIGDDLSNLDNIEGNNKTFNVTGLALFNKDHLTAWYNHDQTLGWAILDSRVKESFRVTNECVNQKGNMGFLIKNLKSSVKPKVNQGEITYQVNVSATAVLQEITCKLDVSDPNNVNQITEQVEKSIKQDIETAVDQAKKLEIDVFGFGKMLFDKEPKIWKENYEKGWGEKFTKVNVNTKVTIQMESVGLKVNSINEKE